MNSIAQYIYSYQNTEERMSKEGGRISSILKDKHLECVSRYVHSRGPTSIWRFSPGLCWWDWVLGSSHSPRYILARRASQVRSREWRGAPLFSVPPSLLSPQVMILKSSALWSTFCFSLLDYLGQAPRVWEKSQEKRYERVLIVILSIYTFSLS